MRFFKITFSILLLIAIIAILALGSLVLFVDPNRLTPVLVKEAKKAGYDLKIDGKLTWSFYPRVGIAVPHMTLQEMQQTTSFLEVNDLRVATELARLWRRKKSISGEIYIGQLHFAKLQMQSVSTLVTWENKILTLDQIQGQLYEGTIGGVFHLNEAATPPKWDWDVHFDNVNIQTLLNDLTPDSKLKINGGKGQLNFKGSTLGKERGELAKNLSGNLTFAISDGALAGIDLNYMVRLVDALINKTAVPTTSDQASQTMFNNFTGSVSIQNGIATSQDLLLTSPSFTTNGMGKVILASKEIQFDLLVKSQQDIQTQWQIPLIVTGSLVKPEVELNKAAIAKEVAKDQLQKVKDKAADYLTNFLNK